MKRRRFLLSATVLAAGPVPLRALTAVTASIVVSLSRTGLLTFLGGRDRICALGQTYQRLFPDEHDPVVLVEEIMSGVVPLHPLSERDLHVYIDHRISQDFEQGDTVLLNGWMLSRTEARQTALYSLLNS